MDHVKIRIAGKVMLAGEYAVLRGGDSLSFAVDRFMEITIKVGGKRWTLDSDMWAEPKVWPQAGSREPALQVLDAYHKIYGLPSEGGLVSIRSDLNPKYGLGSSSALRLGLLYGFHRLHRREEHGDCLAAQQAFGLQKEAQPDASGYDILTQWQGGVLRYTPDSTWPGAWRRLNPARLTGSLEVWVGGKGAPTAGVMQARLDWLQSQGSRWPDLLSVSEALVQSFEEFLEFRESFQTLLQKIEAHRGFFSGAPHEPDWFGDLEELEGLGSSWSFKTTGAGGEDALLIFGSPDATSQAREVLRLRGWSPMPYRTYHLTLKEGSLSHG